MGQPLRILLSTSVFTIRLKTICATVSSRTIFSRIISMKCKFRFLNMEPEQVEKRRSRQGMQKLRQKRCKDKMKQEKKRKYCVTEHRNNKPHANKRSITATWLAPARKRRPCCGLRYDKCRCKVLPGLKKKPLQELAKRFLASPLNTAGDTTDVSVFKELMQDRCKTLSTRVILCYCHIHIVFNQRHLLEAMINKNVFLSKKPWVDWERLHGVIVSAKAKKQLVRSSNFYSTTIRDVLLQSGHKVAHVPTNPIARDVLACKIVGCDAIPLAICDLYDAGPSRDLWKAMLQEWLLQVKSKCSGAFAHYYMKCCLDRLFAVRHIDHGTISWWPSECPSYKQWYKLLFTKKKNFNEEEKFQILCAIYKKLNVVRTGCTFTDALAQTCWSLKEQDNRLMLG